MNQQLKKKMRQKNKELASFLESLITDKDIYWEEAQETERFSHKPNSSILYYECNMAKISLGETPYVKFKANQWEWGDIIELKMLGYGYIKTNLPIIGLKSRLKKIVERQNIKRKEERDNQCVDDTLEKIKSNPNMKKYLRSSKLEDLGI